MEKMFEAASREKLRFSTNRGKVSVEDLWDLQLQELDRVYRELKKELKEDNEESLLADPTTRLDSKLVLMLELIKHVVSVRLAEQKARESARERKDKREKILAIIDEKQEEGLRKLSVDELKALAEAS